MQIITYHLISCIIAYPRWRAREASDVVEDCFTPRFCVGGNNLSQNCALGHHGPFCELCLQGFFADSLGNCAVCESATATFAIAVSALVVFVLALTCYLCIGARRGRKELTRRQKKIDDKLRAAMRNSKINANLAAAMSSDESGYVEGHVQALDDTGSVASALGRQADGVAPDCQNVPVQSDVLLQTSMQAVIFQKMYQTLGRCQIIDCRNRHIARIIFQQGAQHTPADPSKTVD